jgi:hypothetical protein
MVNTRRKRNNKQKKNTQKKRRNKQRKQDNRRRKLIMKKMFGGVDDIYKGPMVGKGTSKKVYTYNKSPRIDDKLLVEIEIEKGYTNTADLVSEAKLENMLLQQLYVSKTVPVVKVSEYTEKLEENQQIISYTIEECELNLSQNEYKIFGDLLLSGGTDNVSDAQRSFFDKIIQCSIFNIDNIQDGEDKLKKALYLNTDCKPANFCYQSINGVTDVKVMDVGIQHLYEITNRFSRWGGKLYVFILYCGLIIRQYNKKDRDIICGKLKKLSLDLFTWGEVTPQALLTSVGRDETMMFMLLYYLLKEIKPYEEDASGLARYNALLQEGLTGDRMIKVLRLYMDPSFFPNVIETKIRPGRRGMLPPRRSTPTMQSAALTLLQYSSAAEAQSSVQKLPPINSSK